MKDAYGYFFDADLTKLPTEVLKSIHYVVRTELEKRHRSKVIIGKQEQESVHQAEKLFEGLPNPHHKYNHHWLKYLKIILDQDWSEYFSGSEEKKYYVYVHYQPNNKRLKFQHGPVSISLSGLPFYVGKGTGCRAYDLKRNEGHGRTLRQLNKSGYSDSDLVSIIADNLSEPDALEIESKLIYFFGTKFERDRRGLLVNLDIPKRPPMIKPNKKRQRNSPGSRIAA